MMVQAGARDRVATKRDNRISPLTTKKIATKAARPTIRWSGLTMTAAAAASHEGNVACRQFSHLMRDKK